MASSPPEFSAPRAPRWFSGILREALISRWSEQHLQEMTEKRLNAADPCCRPGGRAGGMPATQNPTLVAARFVFGRYPRPCSPQTRGCLSAMWSHFLFRSSFMPGLPGVPPGTSIRGLPWAGGSSGMGFCGVSWASPVLLSPEETDDSSGCVRVW